jgi:FkbM family methyltransferase
MSKKILFLCENAHNTTNIIWKASFMMMNMLRKLKKNLFLSQKKMTQTLFDLVDPTFLLPVNALMRLGTDYGGWFIPKNFKLEKESVCYLVGAGEDISFDCALAHQFNCKIRIVDPTPKAIIHFKNLEQAVNKNIPFPINNSSSLFYSISKESFENLVFLPYGLSDQDIEMRFYFPQNPDHVSCSTLNLQKTNEYFVAQCYALSSLMKKQNDYRLDILKMDIEGGEYAVIKDLIKSNLLPNLLLIEFDEIHTPQDENAFVRIKEHIDLIVNADMKCIFIDGCNIIFVKNSSYQEWVGKK